jgi:hypothetical protein
MKPLSPSDYFVDNRLKKFEKRIVIHFALMLVVFVLMIYALL